MIEPGDLGLVRRPFSFQRPQALGQGDQRGVCSFTCMGDSIGVADCRHHALDQVLFTVALIVGTDRARASAELTPVGSDP